MWDLAKGRFIFDQVFKGISDIDGYIFFFQIMQPQISHKFLDLGWCLMCEDWMLKFLTSGESSVNPNVPGFPVVKYFLDLQYGISLYFGVPTNSWLKGVKRRKAFQVYFVPCFFQVSIFELHGISSLCLYVAMRAQ